MHGHLAVLAMRFLVGVLLLPLLFALGHAHAQNSAAISQGFATSETNLATGALMSLSAEGESIVRLANQDNAEELIGVMGDKALLALDTKQVQVVTNGVTQTLVSDINGSVRSGDRITASPISGVGMKATESSIVIGTAQADLTDDVSKPTTISGNNGDQTVRIGSIPAQINVTFYETPADRNSALPPFLQDFASGIAGHEVSPVRIILSALILLLALISIAVLLYSAVQSSIISIGRNPLSESAVHKSLWQVGGIVTGILLLTVIAIYLILIT